MKRRLRRDREPFCYNISGFVPNSTLLRENQRHSSATGYRVSRRSCFRQQAALRLR